MSRPAPFASLSVRRASVGAPVVASIASLVVLATASRGAAATDPDVTSAVAQASPDAPVFSGGWRSDGKGGETRGALGAAIPVLPSAWGAFLTLTPLVELYDDPGSSSLLPNENWRGRLSVAAGTTMDPRSTIALAFDHESDHTSTHTGAVNAVLHTNDVALKVRRSDALGTAALVLGLDARLYVGSRTQLGDDCHGFSGSTTFGGAVSAIFDGDPRRQSVVAPFASAEMMFIVPHAQTIEELRVVGAAGLTFDSLRSRWAILIDGWLGNDVGVERHKSIATFGLALRWVP